MYNYITEMSRKKFRAPAYLFSTNPAPLAPLKSFPFTSCHPSLKGYLGVLAKGKRPL